MSNSTSPKTPSKMPVNVPKVLKIVKQKYMLVPNRSDIKYTKMKESVYIPPSSDVENMILDLEQHKDCHISLPYGNFTMEEVMNFRAILTATNISIEKKISKSTNINNTGPLDALKNKSLNIPQDGKEKSKMLDILKAAQLQLNVDKVVKLQANKTKEVQLQPNLKKLQTIMQAVQSQPNVKSVQLQTIVKTVQLQPTVAKQSSVTETDQTILKSVLTNDVQLEQKITSQLTSQPNVANTVQLTSQPNVANTAQSPSQPNVPKTAQTILQSVMTNDVQLEQNIAKTAQTTSKPNVANTSQLTSHPNATETVIINGVQFGLNVTKSTALSLQQYVDSIVSENKSLPLEFILEPNTAISEATSLDTQSNSTDSTKAVKLQQKLNVTNKLSSTPIEQTNKSILTAVNISNEKKIVKNRNIDNFSPLLDAPKDTNLNIPQDIKIIKLPNLNIPQDIKIIKLPSTPIEKGNKDQSEFHIEHLRSFIKGHPTLVKANLKLRLRLVLKSPNGLVPVYKSFKCTKEGRRDKQAVQNIHEFLASDECLKWIKNKIKCSENKQTFPLTPELEQYLNKEPTIRYRQDTKAIQVVFRLKVGYTVTKCILCSSEGIKDKDTMEKIRSFIYGDEALAMIQDKLLEKSSEKNSTETEKNSTGTRLWQNTGQVRVGIETKYYFDKFKFDFLKSFYLKNGVKSYYPDSVLKVSVQVNKKWGKTHRFDEIYELPEGVELENDLSVVTIYIKCCSKSSVCRTQCRKAYIKDIIPLLNGDSIVCPGCQKVCPCEKSECSNCFVETSPAWKHIDKKIFCNRCFRYFKRNQVMPPPSHQPRSDKTVSLTNYKHFTCGWEQKLTIFSQDLNVWQIYDKISNDQFHPNKIIGSERTRPNLSTRDLWDQQRVLVNATATEILSTTDDQSNLLASNNSSTIFSNLKPISNKKQLKKIANRNDLLHKREKQKELETDLEHAQSVSMVESPTKVVEKIKPILCLTCIKDDITPPFSCATQNELLKHVFVAHEIKLICCSLCYLEKKSVIKFKTEGLLKRHIRAKHFNPAAESDTSCLSDSSNIFVNKTQTSNNLNKTISTGYSSTSASGDILDLMNLTSVSFAGNPSRKRKNATESVVTPTKKKNYFCPVCDFQCDCSLPTILCNTCKHMFHWHCVTVTSDLLNWNCQKCSLL